MSQRFGSHILFVYILGLLSSLFPQGVLQEYWPSTTWTCKSTALAGGQGRTETDDHGLVAGDIHQNSVSHTRFFSARTFESSTWRKADRLQLELRATCTLMYSLCTASCDQSSETVNLISVF